MRIWLSCLALLIVCSCAVAEDATALQSPGTNPATQPATEPVAADPVVDQVLDGLHDVGVGLRDFTADVQLTATDNVSGDSSDSIGTIWYQKKGEGNARMRVDFPIKQVEDKRFRDQRVEYLLDDGWFWIRDYRKKDQRKQQVLRPGQQLNLLKLGEGPFPLPIGQEKQDVHRLFQVKKVAARKDDPADSVHLQLIPKPENRQFAKKFKSIDVWVDPKTHFPNRIETLDPDESSLRTTNLSNIRINGNLNDKDFALPEINTKEWTLRDEPFEE